jgi:ribosomal protein L31
MKQLIITLFIMCVTFSGLTSCKKTEEVKVEKTSTSHAGDDTLEKAMKRASRDLRRLSNSIEGRDWVEVEMWTKELKEGIGYSCVELYMAEHRGISSEFVIMGSRFYDAIRKLTVSCKEHDVETIDSKFNRLLSTCDDCHDIYKEKEDLPLMLQN